MDTLQERLKNYFDNGGQMDRLSFSAKIMPLTIWRIHTGKVEKPRKPTEFKLNKALKRLGY